MSVRGYTRLATTTVRATFAHRLSIGLGTIGVIFQLVAMVALWTALLADGARIGGYSLPEMKGYLLVGFATGVVGRGLGEHVMAERIRSGAVALDLVKPLDYQKMRFAEVLGGLVIEIMVIVAVGAAFVTLAGPVQAPVRPDLLLLSLVAVVPIKFLIIYLSTMLCFWTQNYHGLAWTRTALTQLLSGALVPLALLPGWLAATAAVLPFAAITSTPALIYTGKATGTGALLLIGYQFLWAAGLWILARLAWRTAVRQLTVHGG
ncbi:ABC transporter permease [Polymorphospora rubra]|uniref:ABC-2 type transport system permease protein n=1 Tax=Polymorphospora rubra TaxID=338584 RepID=A0A810N0Z4_9ACTN|nr:ABC-2 family transporter protein [Polymorphospora rubra]BCJ66324.1 hypothetical protein Prubr_33450 [Polymorphospora rubra]